MLERQETSSLGLPFHSLLHSTENLNKQLLKKGMGDPLLWKSKPLDGELREIQNWSCFVENQLKQRRRDPLSVSPDFRDETSIPNLPIILVRSSPKNQALTSTKRSKLVLIRDYTRLFETKQDNTRLVHFWVKSHLLCRDFLSGSLLVLALEGLVSSPISTFSEVLLKKTAAP